MGDGKMIQADQQGGITGNIPCPGALHRPEKVKISRNVINEHSTWNRIKIRNCQPGCFK